MVATPDRLQEHLALIFPDGYEPLAASNSEHTRFSNFRRGLRRPGDAAENWLRRIWHRIAR